MKLIKLILKANNVKPTANINSCLGPHGININNFCKKINSLTLKFKKNYLIPVILILKKNKKFKIIIKNPTVSFFVKKIIKSKYNSLVNKKIFILKNMLVKIYKKKKNDFNTKNKKKILNIILGTVKSMGLSYENI